MNIKNKLQLTAFFISMLMLTACGGGGSTTPLSPMAPPVTTITPTVNTVTATLQKLDGIWGTSCQESPSLSGYDEKQIFNFRGNELTTTNTFYMRDNNAPQTCKNSDQALIARINANVEIGPTISPGTDTEHTKINFTTTKVILSPMNNTLTTLLNNTNHTSHQSIYNGYSQREWLEKQWRDISDISAARSSFKINRIDPDIIQISERIVDGTTHKVLKLGVKGGNVDSDGRPISLTKNMTATLQTPTLPSEKTLQDVGLAGIWKYPCRIAKGNAKLYQISTVNFTNNQLTTSINFYVLRENMTTHNIIVSEQCSSDRKILYQVKLEANIVLGKKINKGQIPEHFLISIKTTKVQIKVSPTYRWPERIQKNFDENNFYNTKITNLYHGYGQTNWEIDKWKNISSLPNAIKNFNIGRAMPDILQLSTVTVDGLTRQELKMGYYKGSYDEYGRPTSLEPKAAIRQ